MDRYFMHFLSGWHFLSLFNSLRSANPPNILAQESLPKLSGFSLRESSPANVTRIELLLTLLINGRSVFTTAVSVAPHSTGTDIISDLEDGGYYQVHFIAEDSGVQRRAVTLQRHSTRDISFMNIPKGLLRGFSVCLGCFWA